MHNTIHYGTVQPRSQAIASCGGKTLVGAGQLAFLTMTNIRHFWVASNFNYPMQTIKTM